MLDIVSTFRQVSTKSGQAQFAFFVGYLMDHLD